MPTHLLLVRRLCITKVSKMNIEELLKVFNASVQSVDPRKLIKSAVKVKGSTLQVYNNSYKITKPISIVGFGKAVLNMANVLETILDANLSEGICNVPEGIFDFYPKPHNSRICFIEGARNNLPDKNAENGAIQIKNMISKLKSDDLAIVLVSGGGSALLPIPQPPVTLEEKLELIKSLGHKGATITELNTVRKKLSQLKGGGFSQIAYPCRIITLILSDVIGDPLGFIASGPTVPNTDGESAALDILKKYKLHETIPESIKIVLGENSKNKELPLDDKGCYKHVDNFILGNNVLAAQEAQQQAEILGYSTVILSTFIQGDVEQIAEIYTNLTQVLIDIMRNKTNNFSLNELIKYLDILPQEFRIDKNVVKGIDFSNNKGICIILAGEPTVKVKGTGKGGRNQQLALQFSVNLHKMKLDNNNITFLSCGTDGIDGPTDSAGAIVYSKLVEDSLKENLNPKIFLENNDTYNFFKKFKDGKYLVKTGHTGTNVMDIHVLSIVK